MKNNLSQKTDAWNTLLKEYTLRMDAIRSRLDEFKRVPQSDYFYELIYCLLTPQTSARNASRVVDKLREAHFQDKSIDPEPFLRDHEHYIRFHHAKSRYLMSAKRQSTEIQQQLMLLYPAYELREWLRQNVLGLGMKEATHFLRNIGRNENLAILDRHILRTLQGLKVIHRFPQNLSPTTYLTIENQFLEFSKQIYIPLNELDLLFWSLATGEIRK